MTARLAFALLVVAACGKSSSARDPTPIQVNDPTDAAPSSPAQAQAKATTEAAPSRDRSRSLTRFDPPAGFTRVALAEGSFGAYLRQLPLRTDRTHVLSHAGERLDSPAAAVATLDVGKRDLQQCADSILRLHAEWLWAAGRADEVGYHFVSGDLSRWRDWRAGQRFRVRGSRVERVNTGKPNDSYEAFKRYLFHVFTYAGTASMHRDSTSVPIADARPGDFFVQPGSPGHAVLIMDIAEHRDGRRVALLGQGFMPAQEFHVLAGKADAVIDRVWFVLPDTGGELATPSWKPFPATTLRRFR